MPTTPVIERLLSRVVTDSAGCWIFQGADNGAGYGVISADGRQSYAHRVAYEYFIAEIPAGLHIDHLCRVTRCCNPWHLDPVTPAVNIARGEARKTSGDWRAAFELAKTECPLGHPYSDENTYYTPKGHRQCRECKAQAKARYTDANRDEINRRERERRGYEGPITACRRAGHPYTEDNTYINPSNGRRICIACRRASRKATA